MNVRMTRIVGLALAMAALTAPATSALAQTSAAASVRKVRVTGIVRDEANAITLPGIPVEVTGGETVFTDVDGRYVLELAPGTYEVKVAMDGYEPRVVKVDVAAGTRPPDVNIGLSMAKFAETVTVVAEAVLDAVTSSAAAQLIERKNAPMITDNLGAQEMRSNNDGDAAAAMQRVTGISVVDNQYVFVRGLGERYSNTQLSGATLPTTEPDKKVVPLDMFPSGLLDSVQVAKSYSPDRSAEFAGGLVQVNPIKLPARPVFDISYGLSISELATGKSIPLSPLGSRDWLGFDNGARALPGTFPDSKIVRRGVFTPTVGFTPDQITGFGRALENRWRPETANGAPGQNWGIVAGNRFGKLGVVASLSHSYREQFVKEDRAFYRVDEGDTLEAVSDYEIQYGTQRAQLGGVANVSYQLTTNHRVSLENFYTHSGKDEGRSFQGPNTENNFYYFNNRLQFIEEELLSNGLSGEHFFRRLGNSRIDWRATYSRAQRNEPDLRETLYQAPLSPLAGGGFTYTGTPVLADESQSGFRMFNDLNDDSLDVAANWSIFSTAGDRPTQYKVGASVIDRTRDFTSRRFRFIPNTAGSGGAVPANLTLSPEEIFNSTNIGTAFRFNEETRPVDAYDGAQTTYAGYGMMDMSISARTRLVAGARVERFEQEVTSFDPFGLFVSTVSSENKNTDFFPSINVVQGLTANSNIRVSYSSTVNRPEFREVATFEFTDVVGARAVRGNPDLKRAIIQNADARWEMFPGARNVLAVSAFYKYFSSPIERVVIAGAQPIVTFQNADSARNYGLELEYARQLWKGLYLNANYTFVDSKITLNPDQRTVQTSLERALAGQSKNVFNITTEYAVGGFNARLLVNRYGDRISDVGSNGAPDIVEQGRPQIDLVVSQRLGRFNLRFGADNLADSRYNFTQGVGATQERERSFVLGRTFSLSVGVNLF
jgi:outer membrane receptor protein involved in Fe transport